MKVIITVIFFLFTTNVFSNKIDSLKTENDILKFISGLYAKLHPHDPHTFSFKSNSEIRQNLYCHSITSKWNIKNWYKVDFNHDKQTDLLVLVDEFEDSASYGYNIYTIIDQGENVFKLAEIPSYFMINCHGAKPVIINNRQLLLFYQTKTIRVNVDSPHASENFMEVSQIDTLIYKYNDFVEINEDHPILGIKSLFFSTSICFGDCPEFTISISKDRNASYQAISNNSLTGKFKARIKEKNFKEIFGLLNYLNIKKLKNNYEIYATDNPTSILKVYFVDGSAKEIKDYGLQGTFGLSALYKLLFELRNNQNWNK